jgi:hypothetical protein
VLTVQWKGVDKLRRDLKLSRAKAVPFALKTALNTTAFEARRIWQREIRTVFVNRNTFTERSILAVKAHGTPQKLQSKVGALAPWMEVQEEGGIVRGRSGHKGIPGPSAAGLPSGARRTRLVRASNRLGALKALPYPTSGSKERRNAASIAMAVRQGRRVALLEMKRGGKGLFAVAGGRQRFNGRRFTRRALKLRLLWDFTRSAVTVPGAHTLQRTMKALEPKLPHIYQAALLDQLRRHRVFGY